MTHRLRFLILILAAMLGSPRLATAQEHWGTNGRVAAVAHEGNRVYVGGTFTEVRRITGPGILVDAGSGNTLSTFPFVAGSVLTSISDGNGGWYIGGTFDSVGGQIRNNLAHINSAGYVTGWNPNVNSTVNALVLSGSTLYAGGDFTSVNGSTTRNKIAAFDAGTGLATAWDPNVSHQVYTLAVSGSTVYAGGYFNTVNGSTTRNNLAAFDMNTGIATGWDPNPNGPVYVVTISGSTAYVGGNFSTVNYTFAQGSVPRNTMAAFDATTGIVTAWDPNPNINSDVYALVVDGSTVYAGGNFTTINGSISRSSLASFDATTGVATSWDPRPNNTVYALTVSGATVYVGGNFTGVANNTLARNYMAAFDIATAAPTAWNPSVNGQVLTLAVSGSTVYAGGDFTVANRKNRSNLAAFNATTGAATAWDPQVTNEVRALVVSGSAVYAGGFFTGVNYNPVTSSYTHRNRLAAFDTATAIATSWDPSVNGLAVQDLAILGSTVYAGGTFTSVNFTSTPRNNLAAFDITTGTVTGWNPDANQAVEALTASGSTVYAGGFFTAVNGGTTRNRLAAFDATTGVATAWDPNVNQPVMSLATSGSTVYAGGVFNTVNGATSRSFVAAFDATTGTVTGWNPNINGPVTAFSVQGSTLYTAGMFTTVNGSTTRNNLAAFGTADPTATAMAWNPNAGAPVWALSASGSAVYAGGDFQTINGGVAGNMALLDPSSGIPLVLDAISFTGRSTALGNELHWTANHPGMASSIRFHIERSADGARYETIGAVSATDKSTTYHFVDADAPAQAIAYYRLRVTGTAGDERFSSIVTLRRSATSAASWAIWPNPAGSVLYVSGATKLMEDASATLIDAQGRVQRQVQLSTNGNTRVDLAGLPSGLYLLRLFDGTVHRLVKE